MNSNKTVDISSGVVYNKRFMNEIKQLIVEGIREKALEDFIKKSIAGTEWQGKVFIAGGYVRDEFMGKDPKDLDLLVNSPNGGIEFAKWLTKKIGAYRGNEIPIPPEPQPQENIVADTTVALSPAKRKTTSHVTILNTKPTNRHTMLGKRK